MCRCIDPDCDKQPSFGPRGTKKALFCSLHMDPETMMNVASRKCSETGCSTEPSYAPVGVKTALFCAKHAPGDYVSIRGKRCATEGCAR